MATMTEFRARGADMTSPATDMVLIDLSATDYTATVPLRAILVGVGGDVKLDTLDGSTVTPTLLGGAILPVIITKIYKVGTTATSIFGLI